MTTGKLQVVEIFLLPPTTVGGGDSGAANMATPDPKEVFVAGSAAGRTIYLDYGGPAALTGFFIGYTNADTAATATVYTGTGPDAGLVQKGAVTLLRPGDTKTSRAMAWIPFPSATSRYWQIALSANSTPFQIGILAGGVAFEAQWDREWGSGRRLIDTAKATQLLSGGFGIQEGARKAAYNWTFGDLTDAETEALWGMVIRQGIGKPIVVVEREGATVGISEQTHYGLLSRIDTFERREPSATKWAFEIEEWI